MRFDRRDFLKAASGSVLFAGLPSRAVLAQAPRQYPFTLGIASGDPAPDGFVIWTRLAPRPLEPHGGMQPQPVAVAWQVAEDAAFSRIVRSGEAIALEFERYLRRHERRRRGGGVAGEDGPSTGN